MDRIIGYEEGEGIGKTDMMMCIDENSPEEAMKLIEEMN